MNRIALVSVTLNAVNPMTNYFQERNPKLTIVNYLDSYLLEKVSKDGEVNDESMRRMFDMLSRACSDGAEGVLLTCSVFSRYAEVFSKVLSKPIVCPDKAMLKEVAKESGETAIICTNPSTVSSTSALYSRFRKEIGRDDKVDMIVLGEAYAAIEHGDFKTHDRMLQEKVAELDYKYSNIVFAQISMHRAALGLSPKHAKIYTSPASAYKALVDAIENKQS